MTIANCNMKIKREIEASRGRSEKGAGPYIYYIYKTRYAVT